MLSLFLFGSPHIDWDHQRVSKLTSIKGQALLFYLALTRRPHPRLKLAGLLWPEKSEQEAFVNLRQTLHLLRKALAGVIVADRVTVSLNENIPIEIDTTEFEKEISTGLAGNMDSLQSAVDRYLGDLLSGFYVEGAYDFDEWVLVERERLRSMMINGLYELTDYFLEERDIRRGIHYTGKLLAMEPWLAITSQNDVSVSLEWRTSSCVGPI